MDRNPEPLVPNSELLYWGADEPAERSRELRAGALSAILRSNQLSNICWRETEILHGIYVAVRDRSWGTVPVKLSNVYVRQDVRSFYVAFDARHTQDDIDFEWHGDIEGDAAGRLVFAMQGQALNTFLRSRIGFCLLHAAEACAGKSFQVQRPDGSTAMASFPSRITREQPLPRTEAMSGLSYDAAPELRLVINLEGDVFQMEDQRNWTDASFKTFCTPLELPCPAEIRKGTSVVQRVAVSISERSSLAVPGERSLFGDRNAVSVDWSSAAVLPQIGLALPPEEIDLTTRHLDLLRCLKLSHLRVDLRLSSESWRHALRQASAEASAIGCRLEAAVFVSGSAERELDALAAETACDTPPICRWLILHESEMTTPEWCIMAARRVLTPFLNAVPIGAGTNAGFFEVGALWLISPPDILSFSMNPQEHAFDNASLVETLAIQKLAIENARQMFGGVQVAVGPITLKPRFQAYATVPAPELPDGASPQQVDTRQWSLFGAVWTVGSLANTLTSGAVAATYYETRGSRGLIPIPGQSQVPSLFESIGPVVFPMYHVFADIAEFATGFIHPCFSSEPLKVCALALSRGKVRRALLANMTADTIEVSIRGSMNRSANRSLDERSAVEAITQPETFRASLPAFRPATHTMTMLPYSIVRLDLE